MLSSELLEIGRKTNILLYIPINIEVSFLSPNKVEQKCTSVLNTESRSELKAAECKFLGDQTTTPRSSLNPLHHIVEIRTLDRQYGGHLPNQIVEYNHRPPTALSGGQKRR